MEVKLDEFEYLGLKLICLIRAGKMDRFKCSSCSKELQEERGCNSISDEPCFYHELIGGEFYSCPMKFIPSSVVSFLKTYDHLEKYPNTAPSYKSRNPRYWVALTFYEEFKSQLKSDNSSSEKEKEDENLLKMRNLLNKGK